MKKISSQTERKLMGVIEKTTDLVSQGLHPNDAIIKAASEDGIRPGEVSLVVHAYNTGRTTRQREEGRDPFEKSAEFELADASKVLEAMYPTQVKTAAAAHAESVVSPEYSFSPKPMLERKQRWEKRARANIDWRSIGGETVETPDPLPSDPAHRAKVASSKVDRLRRETDEARRKAASAFDELGKTFQDLTTYFRRPDAKPLPVVKEAVILMHGDKGEQLVDEIVKVTPSLNKMANHRTGRSLLGVDGAEQFPLTMADLDATEEPFDKIALAISQINDYKTKKAEYLACEKRCREEAGRTISPFRKSAVSHSILDTSSEALTKSAVNPLNMLGQYSLVTNTLGDAANKLKPTETDAQINNVLSELNDPAHEAKLRSINTQAMMQDLMSNDEVISGYDPEEVMEAYNDIVQISPSVADRRAIVQGLLRKQLQQGQLDTFEHDQLLGFEDKLKKQTQPAPGKGGDGSVV